MTENENNLRIDYIEFAGGEIPVTKRFYEEVFGWKFTDYGPDYTSFADGRIAGGFDASRTAGPGTLVVIYATDLDAVLTKVQASGAEIKKQIFDFPGGRRFHFVDPAGNEIAIWSESKFSKS